MNYFVSEVGKGALTMGKEASRRKRAAPKEEEPWGSNIRVPLGLMKTTLVCMLILLALWVPLAEANTPRCNQCYKTVYRTRANSFQIKHFFRVHTHMSTRAVITSQLWRSAWKKATTIGQEKTLAQPYKNQRENAPPRTIGYVSILGTLLKKKTYLNKNHTMWI